MACTAWLLPIGILSAWLQTCWHWSSKEVAWARSTQVWFVVARTVTVDSPSNKDNREDTNARRRQRAIWQGVLKCVHW